MTWVCKQHGKECMSYVRSVCADWNGWNYTPKTVFTDDEKRYLKCVKWVEA